MHCDAAGEQAAGCRRSRPREATAPRTPRQRARLELPRVQPIEAKGTTAECERGDSSAQLLLIHPAISRSRTDGGPSKRGYPMKRASAASDDLEAELHHRIGVRLAVLRFKCRVRVI